MPSSSNLKHIVPAFALAGLAAAPASAAPIEISSNMLVEQRVAAKDGTTRIALVKPARVVPGDRVTFQIAYRNTGRQPVADLVLANPLPAAIAYRAPSPGTPAPELSVDGRTFGPLASLRVPTAGGLFRPATADDVTSVRWRVPTAVAAGGEGRFSFQAVLR